MPTIKPRKAGERHVVPFHPFLITLYPFLFLYGINYPAVRTAEVLVPAAVCLTATLAALPLSRWALGGWSRDKGFRPACGVARRQR